MQRGARAVRTEHRAFSDVSSPRYERRKPEHTVLHRVVRTHLETFLREARERHEKPLPRYVEREFRAYLKCGILANGFLRAQCPDCGEQLVVAFSCKRRGLCPSCNSRRMSNTAAHLVDRVFPDVPVRQWVLSTPFELRFLLARRVDAFNRLMRIFADEVLHYQKARAKELGVLHPVGAGVSFPQRFGSALQLNTHVHAVFCDGVFGAFGALGPHADPTSFCPLPAPDRETLTELCVRVHDRLRRWLVKQGLIEDEADLASNEPPEPTAIDACTAASIAVGTLARVDKAQATSNDADDPEPLRAPKRSRGRHLGEALGFSLHAGVTADAGNFFGRELLLRYCARPALALGRLSELPDGNLAYRLKKPWRPDQTHIILTPLALLARIAALIPPPRSPLIRFHGAFGAHFQKRSAIVAAGKARAEAVSSSSSKPDCTSGIERDQKRAQVPEDIAGKSPRAASEPSLEKLTSRNLSGSALSCDVIQTEPRSESEQRAFATSPWRIDWATLLQRVYDVDALACPNCDGRLRFLELVTDPFRAKTWLERLYLAAEPPATLPAGAPDDYANIANDDRHSRACDWDP